MSFITTKFQEILLSGFRGVVLTRKTGLTDWLTDGRVKNIIPSATRCVGYNKTCLISLTLLCCMYTHFSLNWSMLFCDSLSIKTQNLFPCIGVYRCPVGGMTLTFTKRWLRLSRSLWMLSLSPEVRVVSLNNFSPLVLISCNILLLPTTSSSLSWSKPI